MKKNKRLDILIFLFVAFAETVSSNALGQHNNYEIFALKFGALPFKIPLSYVAVGATDRDSVRICYMIYLLKGRNGRNVLVDAGFTETPAMYNIKNKDINYIRPDSILRKINISPNDITDVIVTHPHWDHIGGIDLFPNAMVWMQKEDFNYFVGTAWQKEEESRGFNGFNSKDVVKIINRNLNKKLTLVNGDDKEIIPGIRVFIGSKHTFESQFVRVGSGPDDVIIASDNSWFYYNLSSMLPIPVTFDQNQYLENLKRMRSMVKNIDLIIPGHDPLVLSKFPSVAQDVVRIRN